MLVWLGLCLTCADTTSAIVLAIWRRRAAGLAVAVTVWSFGGLLPCAAASASITATGSASALAGAIVADPATLTSSSFVAVPNAGKPTATATTFGPDIAPWAGSTMAVLSNGDATLADTSHTQSTGPSGGPNTADNNPNVVVRGGHDVTVLQLNVVAPS